jgi:transcriptional regulator with XRE-family HTH domain
VIRRNWKRVRPSSAIEALRLCKEFAQEKKNLSIERIADRMGVSHDSLYKWLATGRLPYILVPAYEHACGCHFASEWAAASAGKLVISMPAGRAATQTDLVELNGCFGAALQLLSDFYAAPGRADATETLAALTAHLQQVAWHHANVGQHSNPELEF